MSLCLVFFFYAVNVCLFSINHFRLSFVVKSRDFHSCAKFISRPRGSLNLIRYVMKCFTIFYNVIENMYYIASKWQSTRYRFSLIICELHECEVEHIDSDSISMNCVSPFSFFKQIQWMKNAQNSNEKKRSTIFSV